MMMQQIPPGFSMSDEARRMGKKVMERLILGAAGALGSKIGEEIAKRLFGRDEEEGDE